jgi:hypothetical protein
MLGGLRLVLQLSLSPENFIVEKRERDWWLWPRIPTSQTESGAVAPSQQMEKTK